MSSKRIVILSNCDSINLEAKNLETNMPPSKDEVLSFFKMNFKHLKFLKNKQTWKKIQDDLTFVCNVQNSQWSKEDYYVNCGILINKLSYLPHNYGTFETRVDISGSPEIIFNRAISWFDKYNSLIKLIESCKNNEFNNEVYCKKILDELNINKI